MGKGQGTAARPPTFGRAARVQDELAGIEQVVVGKRDLGKIRYSHADMIDTILGNPWVSQNELAARYGYSASWVSIVLASDAFQSAFAARREEVVDPALKATLEERFRALTLRSLDRLMGELDKPACKPEVMLKAAELGAKSLGIGGHAAPPPPAIDSLANLASRLVALQSTHRQGAIYEGQVQREPAEVALHAASADELP